MDGFAYATYFAEWSSESEQPLEVRLDIIMGKWGNKVSKSKRVLASVLYRGVPDEGFMIIDSVEKMATYEALAGSSLSRSQILAHAEGKEILFAMLDVIYSHDRRIPWKRQ